MMALIYIGIVCYLLIGLSIYKYVIERGDKLYVGILWLFGWGLGFVSGISLYLILSFVDLFKYIKSKCKIQR